MKTGLQGVGRFFAHRPDRNVFPDQFDSIDTGDRDQQAAIRFDVDLIRQDAGHIRAESGECGCNGTGVFALKDADFKRVDIGDRGLRVHQRCTTDGRIKLEGGLERLYVKYADRALCLCQAVCVEAEHMRGHRHRGHVSAPEPLDDRGQRKQGTVLCGGRLHLNDKILKRLGRQFVTNGQFRRQSNTAAQIEQANGADHCAGGPTVLTCNVPVGRACCERPRVVGSSECSPSQFILFRSNNAERAVAGLKDRLDLRSKCTGETDEKQTSERDQRHGLPSKVEPQVHTFLLIYKKIAKNYIQLETLNAQSPQKGRQHVR